MGQHSSSNSTLGDYFICWQFTKPNAEVFRAQDEIITENIIPIVPKLLPMVNNFYVTRVDLVYVRLQSYLPKKNCDKLIKLVKSELGDLQTKAESIPKLLNIVGNYGPENKELDFREFLTDISLINLDLHSNIAQAKSIAFKTKCDTKLGANIWDCLEEYFDKSSEHYRNIINEERDTTFWERMNIHDPGKTPWAHFYFNPILGYDC